MGGTGRSGVGFAADLASRGDDVVILTRSPRSEVSHRQVEWDGVTAGPWASELAGSALVNLAGELVDRRPTSENIALLKSSRVEPTRALAKAAAGLDAPPVVWVQASTLAIYGDAGEAVLDETAPLADGPPQMAGVARAWVEAAAGVPVGRQVVLRTGIVFDRDSPALSRLSRLVRWGLGGRISHGRQWVSWIHIADFLAVVRRAIDDEQLSGIVHATSPNPVRNADLMTALRRVLHRPATPPTPALLVRIGSVVLRTDPALALTGRRCVPGRLGAAGFTFSQPQLSGALADLFLGGSQPDTG